MDIHVFKIVTFAQRPLWTGGLICNGRLVPKQVHNTDVTEVYGANELGKMLVIEAQSSFNR